MEEPYPDVDDIGSFNKYIGVTFKLDDEANSGGKIANSKFRATDTNGSAIG